jgi:hypothetical protein
MSIHKTYLIIFLRSILVATICSEIFISCSKDKEEPTIPSPTIAGIWEGKFGYDTTAPAVFYGFNIKPENMLERKDSTGTITGVGTWTLSGNVFTGTYTKENTFFSLAGNVDLAIGKIAGHWGFGYNTGDGGTFYLDKKN